MFVDGLRSFGSWLKAVGARLGAMWQSVLGRLRRSMCAESTSWP